MKRAIPWLRNRGREVWGGQDQGKGHSLSIASLWYRRFFRNLGNSCHNNSAIIDCPKETMTSYHPPPPRVRILQLIPAMPQKPRLGWQLRPRSTSLFCLLYFLSFSIWSNLNLFHMVETECESIFILGFTWEAQL